MQCARGERQSAQSLDFVQHVARRQPLRRDVNRQGRDGKTAAVQVAQGADRLSKNQSVDLSHESEILGNRQEVHRLEHPARGVVQPHKRLDSDKTVIDRIELRLEIGLQLVEFDRPAKFGPHFVALLLFVPQARFEGSDLPLAARLGLVHRQVAGFQQGHCAAPILGVAGRADAGAEPVPSRGVAGQEAESGHQVAVIARQCCRKVLSDQEMTFMDLVEFVFQHPAVGPCHQQRHRGQSHEDEKGDKEVPKFHCHESCEGTHSVA